MSETKITSLAPHVARLTWIWARRSIAFHKKKSVKDPEVIRLAQLAADRGDPDAQWWLAHRHLLLDIAFNRPDDYSEDDVAKANYYYHLGYSTSVASIANEATAARMGCEDAVLNHVHWVDRYSNIEDSFKKSLLEKAAALGSVHALAVLEKNVLDHLASIKDRALKGDNEAAECLTEYDTGSERDPLSIWDYAKECTADDALWRFLAVFSGPLHPVVGANHNLDWEISQVIKSINGCAARYQFGLCAHQMMHVISDRVVQLFMPHVLHFRRSSEGAKEAVVAWTLVGHRAGICRDIRRMIGQLIWDGRVEWTVTEATTTNLDSQPRRSLRTKRVKR